jgi:hypothetical protein
MKKIATGNKAVAEAVKQVQPAVVAAYPITPQTENLKVVIFPWRASIPRWLRALEQASPEYVLLPQQVPTVFCICTR